MKYPLWKLFLIFVKIGAILIGGGFVILPILTCELSEKRQLLTKEELTEFFVLAQSMPGIVAINTSCFAGYKLRGVKGSILSACGIVFVPFLSICVLSVIWNTVISNTIVQSIVSKVVFAVIVLVLLSICEIWDNSKQDLFFYLILTMSVILLLIFKYTPVQTIIVMTICGLIYKIFEEKSRCR